MPPRTSLPPTGHPRRDHIVADQRDATTRPPKAAVRHVAQNLEASAESKLQCHACHHLPSIGFVRLRHIIGDPGDPTANPPKPPIPGIVPVARSTWYAGIAAGRYPRGIKLSSNVTAWKIEDIRALVEQLGQQTGQKVE